MPSPFPGMNPYLEQKGVWRDFHTSFLVFLRLNVLPLVSTRYVVELEENIYVDRSGRDELIAIADTSLSTSAPPVGAGRSGAATAPHTNRVRIPKLRRKKARRLVIRDTKKRAVVTVIELLSPSEKKSGKDRVRYLEKRADIFRSTSNLVEIDLLRGGHRMPFERPLVGDYCAMVSRASERPDVGVWSASLRDPIPTIPLPLQLGELEPQINLQAVLNQTYDGSGYAYHIYQGTPDPPLSAEDAEWAKQFVPGTT